MKATKIEYYMIKAYTPYVGEEIWLAVALPDNKDIHDIADDLMYENAFGWYDEEYNDYETFEDYLDDCGYDLDIITEAEFIAEMIGRGDTFPANMREYAELMKEVKGE